MRTHVLPLWVPLSTSFSPGIWVGKLEREALAHPSRALDSFRSGVGWTFGSLSQSKDVGRDSPWFGLTELSLCLSWFPPLKVVGLILRLPPRPRQLGRVEVRGTFCFCLRPKRSRKWRDAGLPRHSGWDMELVVGKGELGAGSGRVGKSRGWWGIQ